MPLGNHGIVRLVFGEKCKVPNAAENVDKTSDI